MITIRDLLILAGMAGAVGLMIALLANGIEYIIKKTREHLKR